MFQGFFIFFELGDFNEILSPLKEKFNSLLINKCFICYVPQPSRDIVQHEMFQVAGANLSSLQN